jgi:6-phosphogluconate dehydrogenase (decarboxylating)
MMIKGNINQIIYIIMGAYLHDFNELVYNDSDEDIENITDIICRKGGHLVRSLLHDFTKLVK